MFRSRFDVTLDGMKWSYLKLKMTRSWLTNDMIDKTGKIAESYSKYNI